MVARRKNFNWLELGVVFLVGVSFYSLHFYHYFSSFGADIFFFNDPDDAKIYSWNTWHFAHQLSNGDNPYYSDFICWPKGASLWMHAYTVWFGLLHFFIDNVNLSINVGIAIQLVMAYVGFYYFAKQFVKRPIIASTVAYASVFNTYILAKCGVHFNLVLIGVLPFLLLYVYKLLPLVEGKVTLVRKHILSFVLLMVFAFFTDYYVVFYVLAFLLVYLIWYGTLSAWFDRWNWKKTFAIVGLFSLGHVVMRLFRISGFSEKGAIWGAADVRLLFTPGSNSAYQRDWIIDDIPNSINDNKIYLGISLVVYFIIALVYFYKNYKKDKESRFLFFASILFLLVSLPVIQVGEQVLFYNFTSVVHYIPFVNNVRAPDRFILMFFIVSSLFIFRVVFLETEYTKKWSKYVVFAIVFVVWFYVNHTQEKMQIVDQPPTSAGLQKYEGQTILIFPFGIRDGYQQFGDFDANQALLQVQYGFKMPSGYLSRLSDDTWKNYTNSDFYKTLVSWQDNKNAEVDLKKALREHGILAVYLPHTYRYTHRLMENQLLYSLGPPKLTDLSGVLFVVD